MRSEASSPRAADDAAATPPPRPPLANNPSDASSGHGVASVRRRHEEMSARTTRALQAMQKDKIVRWLRTKLKVPPPSSASESAADAEMVDRSPPPIDPSLAAGIAASAASLASLRTNVNATSSQSIPLSADAPLDDHLRI